MIREFVIGLLVFTAVALVLLQTVSDETTKNFPEVVINSSYVQSYHYSEADALVDGVTSKAPGGIGSNQPGGSGDIDTDLGYKTGASIFQSKQVLQNIISGSNATGEEGLATTFGINKEFQRLAIGIVAFLISIILISSLLSNIIK
jgi:hypothetical protein